MKMFAIGDNTSMACDLQAGLGNCVKYLRDKSKGASPSIEIVTEVDLIFGGEILSLGVGLVHANHST